MYNLRLLIKKEKKEKEKWQIAQKVIKEIMFH